MYRDIFCYKECYKGIGFEVLRLRIQGQVFMTRNEASNLLLERAQELDHQLSKVYNRPTLVMTWTYTQLLWWSGMLFSPTWSLSLSLSLLQCPDSRADDNTMRWERDSSPLLFPNSNFKRFFNSHCQAHPIPILVWHTRYELVGGRGQGREGGRSMS